MNNIPYGSIIFIFIGIIILVFNRAIGLHFCTIGKYIWSRHHKKNPSSLISPKEVQSLYNPEKAPDTFKIMGVVLIIGGLISLFY
jgi:hypothetical protein